ncbi:MAG: tetratricopeptide repeat protein, partial [Saprospiraceae bacterium]|nr:tetratricopeptide repeat protein [Saprospiraceae bacterium]
MKHYSSNLLLILLFATYLPQILYANRKPEHIDKDSCFLLNNEFTHAWLNQNIKLRDSLILNSKIFDVLGIANITKQQASQITTSDAEQLIANLNNWQKCYFESIFIVFVDSVVMQSGSNEIENYLIHKNRETEKILSHIDMKLLTNEIYLRVLRYYFHLGDLFLDKSMPHDALTAFEIGATLAAQRKDIFQIPYLFNLERIASTQTDLTLYEKAKETYNKLLDISYNDPDIDSELKSTIVVNASSLFLKMGLYSDALRIVERSNLKDNEYLLQLNKATCLEKLGYSDKAADILKDLLKLKPDDPTRQLILINIGNNLLSRREYLEAEKYTKDAINLLQKNIAIDSSIEYISNLAIAYFNLGEIYLHTESLSEAASWYSKALQTRKIYTTDSADFNILQDLDRLSLISLRQGKFTDCFDKTNFVFSNLLEKYRKYYSILNYEEGQHLLQKWNSLLGRSISTMLELRNYHPINIEDIFEYDINLRGSLTNQARLIKEEINVRNKLNQDSTYILYENLRSKLIAA